MITAFLSGIVATLTPCTIVMIPIFLYKFGIWGDKKNSQFIKDLIFTLIGFFVSLFTIALLFNHLSNSNLFNLFKLIFGTSLIILGILQLTGKFNINLIQKVTNPFILGMILPWTISFSPCVLPIFSTFLAGSINSGKIFIQIFFFGLGLLSPAVLSAVLGNKIFDLLKKSSKITGSIEKFAGFLIIGSGIYMNFQILNIHPLDIIISGIFFTIIIVLTAYLVFIRNKKRTIANILMFLAFVIIWVSFLTHCHVEIKDENKKQLTTELTQCNAHDIEECQICKRCAIFFSISAITGTTGYILSQKKIKLKS